MKLLLSLNTHTHINSPPLVQPVSHALVLHRGEDERQGGREVRENIQAMSHWTLTCESTLSQDGD